MTPTCIRFLTILQGLVMLVGFAMMTLFVVDLPLLVLLIIKGTDVDIPFIQRYLAFASSMLLTGILIVKIRRNAK